MISIKVKIFVFILFIPFLCVAQSLDLEQNDIQVNFNGLKKTKASFLYSLLEAQNNSNAGSLNQVDIERDLNLLKNLPSVANAIAKIDTTNSEINISYLIEERTTALPIFNFGGIKDNIWFSVGFIENNFRGLGNQLLAFYQNNDQRHSGQLYYKQPRLNNPKWGYSVSLHKWSSLEPLFFEQGPVSYNYDNNGVGLSIIRNITVRQAVELRGTFFKESYVKNEDLLSENIPSPDNFEINKFLTDLSASKNGLNYDFFYLKGYELKSSVQNVIGFSDKTLFNSFQFQGKLFLRPKRKINIAARFKLGISTNNDSPFAPFVVDSHVNIRGVGNRIDRGTAQAVLNVETRFSIYHKRHWASQFVLFSDSGTWRIPGGTLKQLFQREQFRQFVGLGFRLIYQKVFGSTLRIDYGIDVFNTNQRGVVIGLGQYF